MDARRNWTMGLLAVALVGAVPPPPPPAPPHGIAAIVRSTTIRMSIFRPRRAAPAGPPMIEKRGPHCIPAGEIAGAAVVAPDAVDFVLRGGERMRARLDGECQALNFYGGFYLNPGEDARICADRDVIRTRAGGECEIDRFRRLLPATPPKP